MILEQLFAIIAEEMGWKYSLERNTLLAKSSYYWFYLKDKPPTARGGCPVGFMIVNKDPCVLYTMHGAWKHHSKIDLKCPGSVDKLRNFLLESKRYFAAQTALSGIRDYGNSIKRSGRG